MAWTEEDRSSLSIESEFSAQKRTEPIEALSGGLELDDLALGETLLDGAREPHDVEGARRGPEGGPKSEAGPRLGGHVKAPVSPSNLEELFGGELEGLGPDPPVHVGEAKGDSRVPAVGDHVEPHALGASARGASDHLPGEQGEGPQRKPPPREGRGPCASQRNAQEASSARMAGSSLSAAAGG
jgi:hypothetical protein